MSILPFVRSTVTKAAGPLLLFAACGRDPIEPRFSALEREIFRVSCSLASCHGAAEKGGLSLRGADAYSELVGAPAEGELTRAKGLVRVVPGDADASLMFRKVTTPRAGDGARMPDVAGESLDDEQVEAIRAWIAGGAKND